MFNQNEKQKTMVHVVFYFFMLKKCLRKKHYILKSLFIPNKKLGEGGVVESQLNGNFMFGLLWIGNIFDLYFWFAIFQYLIGLTQYLIKPMELFCFLVNITYNILMSNNIKIKIVTIGRKLNYFFFNCPIIIWNSQKRIKQRCWIIKKKRRKIYIKIKTNYNYYCYLSSSFI